MVAAAQSSYPSPSPNPRRPRRSKAGTGQVGVRSSKFPQKQPQATPKVTSLSQALELPLWLRLLIATQQSTSVLVIILGLLTLASYASVVYAQHRWGQAYNRLQTLRQQEYQITAIHESLKQNLVSNAANAKGLTWPNPNQMVFVEPTQARPLKPATSEPGDPLPNGSFPLGY